MNAKNDLKTKVKNV